MCFCGIRKWNRFHAQVSCSVESSTGRLFNEERRTQSYAGAKGATSMLQQIVEPGEEVEEVEEVEVLASLGEVRELLRAP